eukprot:6945901-Ditylum_brightwellii.AAC.1
MGTFSTELDIFMQTPLRESLRYAKLIGTPNEEADLQGYSNELLKCFVEEQIIHFPNSVQVVCDWIAVTGELFNSVIVYDVIPMTDLPPVQHSALFVEIDEEISQYRKEITSIIITAALKDMGDSCITL